MTTRFCAFAFVWLITISPALSLADEPWVGKDASPGKIVLDLWDAVYLHGTKTGYIRTSVKEYGLFRNFCGRKMGPWIRLASFSPWKSCCLPLKGFPGKGRARRNESRWQS